MSPRLRLLVAALLASCVLGSAGCDDKRETLTCKDGTFVSGTGAREICAHHGGVR